MYRLKQVPEDFVVIEESNPAMSEQGKYAYYLLKKRNMNTQDAIIRISEAAKVPPRFIGFAGNKDRNAVTEQKISILNGQKRLEGFSFNNFELKYLGRGNEPISLGSNEGNNFQITIRNLEGNDVKKLSKIKSKSVKMPNYFGPQRFSKNNHLVGKSIIKRDFKKAVGLILENNGDAEQIMKSKLEESKNNYIGVLRTVPLKTRKIFVHAYQSYLFNRIAKELVGSGFEKSIELPLPGFGFEIKEIKDKATRKIFERVIADEKINPRDFVINQMPELSSEGAKRNLFAKIANFEKSKTEEDELNHGKKKMTVKFFLEKGCYATVAVDLLLS
jgi:tRNA pseudouridine13 synthase